MPKAAVFAVLRSKNGSAPKRRQVRSPGRRGACLRGKPGCEDGRVRFLSGGKHDALAERVDACLGPPFLLFCGAKTAQHRSGGNCGALVEGVRACVESWDAKIGE